ncbi:hypothetical protein SGLAM104S_08331 [Streptomyces glaucescens]
MGPAGRAEHRLPPTVAVFQILKEEENARQQAAMSARPAGQGAPGASANDSSSATVQVAAISIPSSVTESGGQP